MHHYDPPIESQWGTFQRNLRVIPSRGLLTGPVTRRLWITIEMCSMLSEIYYAGT